jgi:hypothetical protein
MIHRDISALLRYTIIVTLTLADLRCNVLELKSIRVIECKSARGARWLPIQSKRGKVASH